jgi:hypothetical protein
MVGDSEDTALLLMIVVPDVATVVETVLELDVETVLETDGLIGNIEGNGLIGNATGDAAGNALIGNATGDAVGDVAGNALIGDAAGNALGGEATIPAVCRVCVITGASCATDTGVVLITF